MGFSFTITDPQGRIQLGDMALFYDPLAGDADSVGINADNIVISADGTTLSGNVPSSLPASNGQLLVSVKVTGESSRFTDLPFQIEGPDCPPFCTGGGLKHFFLNFHNPIQIESLGFAKSRFEQSISDFVISMWLIGLDVKV